MLINVCAVILFMIYGVEGLTITQSQKVLIKQTQKSVNFQCDVTDLSTTYVHWYHKKDGGTIKRLLYISDSGVATNEIKDFIGEKKGNSYEIKVQAIKKEHAGVYYCACWDGNWIKHFGSGTRLIVTELKKDKPEPPNLTAYPPAERQSDKSTMLCQASGMFPDLVKFSWEMKSSSGDWTNVPDQHVLEQRDEDIQNKERPDVFVTSMMIVDKNTAKNNNYRCTVTHEGTNKPQTAEINKDEVKSSLEKSEDDAVNPTCPPSEESAKQKSEKPSVYLFMYAYGIMLMKNGVYFAVVSIYLLKRRAGKKNESSQETNKQHKRQA